MFVTIYGRPGCPFCVFAKDLAQRLESRDAIEGYRYVDMPSNGLTKADLSAKVGQTVHTVPQVFLNDAPIGGFSEFDHYVREHGMLTTSPAH
ncbi:MULTISPECIES: GrxA family glutaredoxin [Halomonas]|uniref:GrxA family glutaredoxin n=2 Tax=Halomonas TaxID=2745 RepID=A0A7X4VXH2_9GAMM|nr:MULTISPECIES: GrxA family glutaredoxin [Halomonas]MDR5902330.1 GrxA family glutaredoxin [Halomonas icarae]NAW12139.1 GrxA family glutaredoxin [Halomonas icarae]TDB05564.1 GrxA family glutaredoxin [Halomonas marinisediminis]